MSDVNIDLMANGEGQGQMAQQLISQGKLNPLAMRPWIGRDGKAYMSVNTGQKDKDGNPTYKAMHINAATLRKDEWKLLDEAIVPIAETRLNGIQDLISRGLVYNLGNAMGTTVLEWQDVSDAMEATLTMDGVTRSSGDRPVFGTKYLPIPILHVDYEINARVLEASRKLGNPLDTTSAERAARKVAEKLESMLFTDTEYTFGGGTIQSYINYDNRNTVTLDTEWDDSAITGKSIVDDVREMKQESLNNYHYGPWVLYVPTGYETVLDMDYDATTPGTTVRERILKIAGIQDIKVIDTLTADNVVLVQMTPDTVRLVNGMGLTNVQWATEGEFITKYKVMAIQVPQIRSDQNGKCGIVHASFGS